jgi:hypothetical protein
MKKKHKLTLYEQSNIDELEFLIELNNALDLTKYKIKRTNTISQYHPVDYDVYRDDTLIMHIEIKCRHDLSYYLVNDKTLMIGATKLKNIEKDYFNTLLVWRCKTKKQYHFTWFKPEFNKLPTKWLNNSPVKYIPIEYCSNGFENLIHSISSKS